MTKRTTGQEAGALVAAAQTGGGVHQLGGQASASSKPKKVPPLGMGMNWPPKSLLSTPPIVVDKGKRTAEGSSR